MKLGRKAVAIGVVGLLALTACGRADDDSTGGESAAGSTTTVDDAPAEGDITIWAMGEEGEKLPDFVQGFTDENPDANVEVTTIPWADVMTKFQTAVAAGTVPDAIMIGSSFMPTMVATGGLAPVPDGLVDSADFVEGAAASTVADGVEYGVPWYVETRVLYYRSDLAKAAGVEAPTSWEELTAFAQAMQANGSTYGLQLPMGDAEDSTQVILPFYSQAGGSVLDEAGDAFDLDNQAMIDALDYYASFFAEGLSPLSGYGDSQNSAFVDGSDPAFISGPWMVNVLADLQGEDWVEQNVATVPVPAGSANNDSYIGGAHLGVFAEAKNADGAWKLVRWLAQPETQQAWFDATSDLPALTTAWDYEPLTSNPRTQVLQEQLDNTIAPPTVPSWDELSATIETEAEKVANGQVTSEDAAKAIQAKADTLGLGW
ncbi:multiple sugar transport system substrate-binding protein [Cellulosimicrobium cellulans]|uniref:extracellular solute-binding protein n=1 Tax=Cellulosimicrobium cellulans TaxID=1710 RepID=UPI00195B3356|nr:extracellular solute-binding protein [Cellulosimicrobium cellulans]MBM7817760.1 multiple sugar transport system substrate-binding protein [Cellulosimicrobium cellulans]